MAIKVIDMISGGFVKSEFFTSSGTWTVPSSIIGDTIKVRICAGGAGGRSSGESGESGEAGNFLEQFTTFSGNITVTIGAGGAIDAAGGNSTLTSGATLTVNGGRVGRQQGVGAELGDMKADYNKGFGGYGRGGKGEVDNLNDAEAGSDGACEIIWTQIEE